MPTSKAMEVRWVDAVESIGGMLKPSDYLLVQSPKSFFIIGENRLRCRLIHLQILRSPQLVHHVTSITQVTQAIRETNLMIHRPSTWRARVRRDLGLPTRCWTNDMFG